MDKVQNKVDTFIFLYVSNIILVFDINDVRFVLFWFNSGKIGLVLVIIDRITFPSTYLRSCGPQTHRDNKSCFTIYFLYNRQIKGTSRSDMI